MMCMRRRILLPALIATASLLLSCSAAEPIGEPYILFEVHGTVMDQEGNPIQGIEVSAGTSDNVKTNLNGNFTFNGRSVPMSAAKLTFTDKDGQDNGGEFQKQTVYVEMNLKIPGEEYGNFKGKYFAQNVEVRMIPKNDVINPDPEL